MKPTPDVRPVSTYRLEIKAVGPHGELGDLIAIETSFRPGPTARRCEEIRADGQAVRCVPALPLDDRRRARREARQ